ncbi:hypothetical protein ASD46_18690 [Rhizobium sp. Root491]|uniref:hypothetical protein n=1 Tax=Rhizobium sp. Root491 TaxID=1736548 RepID=UPI000714B3C5|nr:hypothetical protein [Rhizobium sp. Root491]KQY41344.1 hypothetical protein ASD46_18690 [Rhizobium sp. Root491]
MSRVFDNDGLADLASKIDQKVQALLDRMYIQDMVVEEEDFSQLIVNDISQVVNNYSLRLKPKPSHGMYFTSSQEDIKLKSSSIDGRNEYYMDGRPMKRKGRGSEEKITGADMLFFFESDGIDGLEPKKGLLAQAKRWKEDFHYTSLEDLFEKCRIMNGVTEHSYAFIYARNGLFVYRNPITVGTKRLRADETKVSIGRLVADFVDCSIGDPEITEKNGTRFLPVAKALKKRRLKEAARAMGGSALIIEATS